MFLGIVHETQDAEKMLVIKPPPLSKSPAIPPQPAPIEHTSSYLLRSSKHNESIQQDDNESSLGIEKEPFTGNAVDWILKKADESLDAVEQDPPAYAKAIYEISTGPVGTTASKGVSFAAKMTIEAGSQALQAAAPVGKWILAQGAKAVGDAIIFGIKKSLRINSTANLDNTNDSGSKKK